MEKKYTKKEIAGAEIGIASMQIGNIMNNESVKEIISDFAVNGQRFKITVEKVDDCECENCKCEKEGIPGFEGLAETLEDLCDFTTKQKEGKGNE